MMHQYRWIAAAAAAALATLAHAGSTWDEAIDGDLSDDINAPTSVGALQLGSNIVRNNVANSTSQGGDIDILSFEVVSGTQLAAILLEQYTSNDGVAFLALAAGAVAPADPNFGDLSGFIGGALFGSDIPGDAQGDDLLDTLAAGTFGGTGSAQPLGPGVYTLFIQQTGASTDLAFNFQVIPAPASTALIGLAGLVATRRRR